MLKRELIRICVFAFLGFFVALIGLINGLLSGWLVLFAPLYFVGMFYAGKTLVKMIGIVIKTYFSYQFMSLLTNPLLGTIVCVLLFGLGLVVLFSFAWLLGIGKCIYSLATARQLDLQCGVSNGNEEYWDWQ